MNLRDKRELDLFFARQRKRLAKKLDEREERLKERLKARGMDRAGRQALTLIVPDTDDGWQQTHHASGQKKPSMGWIEHDKSERRG